LESFCKNQNIDIIDLMKMDIEGGEYKVFEQSINYIKDKVRLIYLELHEMDEKHNIEKFKRFIVNNNFKIEVEVMNRTLVIRNLNIL